MIEIWRKLILNTKPPRVVTIIGGGGKTSLMNYLLTILKNKDDAAVGTSTTKLSNQPVRGHCFITIQSVAAGHQAVKQAISMQHHVTLVSGEEVSDQEKIIGIPSEWIDQLAAAHKDVIFVVEGDGSAGKSLKGHLAHEPVIPRSSSLVVVVIGIDSAGRSINFQNVHRPERICELTGAGPDAIVTTEMMTQLLLHPQGYLHNCPQDSRVVLFINKVESAAQHQQAEKLAAQMLVSKHPQLCGVIIGSVMKEEGLWLQG
ncbi:MAG: putative selenium-dependent hydroxylase accessory protein YqeC [Sporomusaceae bacterium]|nr:putative selenium-dependent hydroxylase accessory protein YqeC [Sporomusaceae bacterium]